MSYNSKEKNSPTQWISTMYFRPATFSKETSTIKQNKKTQHFDNRLVPNFLDDNIEACTCNVLYNRELFERSPAFNLHDSWTFVHKFKRSFYAHSHAFQTLLFSFSGPGDFPVKFFIFILLCLRSTLPF